MYMGMRVWSDIGHNIYIYISRLIIEHPREWLASLADYSKYSYSNLINVHEMIDNFSEVDTEYFAGGGEGEMVFAIEGMQ